MAQGPDAFRTISEASDELGVAQHVLRFWETKFNFVRPMKRAGGRRFYRPRDIAVLATIKRLLHEDGHSIKEVQALHRAQGFKTGCWERPTAQDTGGSVDRTSRLQAALVALETARRRLDGLLAGR
jgi:DNA-binding transcriptional MerR regulator